MRALSIANIATAMCLGCVLPAFAQVAPKPGQIAVASEVSALPPAIAPASGSPVIANEIDMKAVRHDRLMNRIWIASMLAMAAASGFDAETSWGKLEANSLLASRDGTFGAKGVSIKAGAAAAIIIPQILFRKHKDLRVKFAIGNFAGAAVFSGVAIHNLGIAAPK